jgi:hypothetical protein
LSAALACLVLAGCAGKSPSDAPSAAVASNHKLVSFAPANGGSGASRSLVGPTLSRDALRTCVKQEHDIDNGQAAIKVNDTMLGMQRSALESEEKAIEGRRPQVDTKSQKSVDDFNAAVTAHTGKVNNYNQAVHALKVQEADVNGVVNAFNTGCAGHSYFTDDMDAVTAELGPVRRGAAPLPPPDPLAPPAP